MRHLSLMVLLLFLSLLFIQYRLQEEHDIKQRSSEREFKLLSSLIHNDLQTGNYQHINSLITEWGENNDDIREMELTSSNGYLFNKFSRAASTNNPISFTTTINYSYRGEANFRLTKDFHDVKQRQKDLVWQIGSAYFMISILLISLTYALINYLKKSDALSLEIKRRQEAEAALQKQYDQLEESVASRTAELASINRELETFSYSVSHDLRAPLRAIDGFSMALLEEYNDKLDSTGRDYLKRVRNGAQKMGLLIDDLLKLSRVTRSELKLKQVNLSRLATTVVEELRQSEPERNVQITIAPELWAYGDATLLHILLTNLLGNAWKFTRFKKDATIEFGVRSELEGKPFFICDNGAGFDMKYSAKLFTAFQRLHSLEEFEGTGIGLATVQRIIAKHGGNIRVEAAIDQGATFYFTLCSSNRGQKM